jgi:GNAT superfamily N-acetyltransferase
LSILLNSKTDLSLLDRPIWNALSTRHAALAEGNDLAKRYPTSIGPLSATRDESVASFDALAKIVLSEEVAALFVYAVPVLPPGWTLTREVPLTQMVWNTAAELPEVTHPAEPLSIANADEMLELVKLTQPGPFGRRTPELGTYLGIPDHGRLAAMAGERLQMPGLTEISAVCTHPDYRGRGYARSLISTLIHQIVRRGDVPFLHVASENTGAMRVYEGLGFKIRRSLIVVVFRRDAPAS